MHPDGDLLAAVALGETIDDDNHQHVWGCTECRREVGELRDVLAIVTQRPPVSLTKPNPDVWDHIEAQLGRAGDELISSDRRDDRRARPRRIMPWVAGAAAAGLVVGGVSGAIVVRGTRRQVPWWRRRHSRPSTPIAPMGPSMWNVEALGWISPCVRAP